jgi:hypothetical protein
MKQRRLLRTTEAVQVGRALHMEARVLSVWSSDGELPPPEELPPLSPDDVVQNLDAPALANALALVRLGHNAETFVVRGSPSALELCWTHAVAAAPFPPLMEAMPGAAHDDYGPERLARDELACSTRPGRLHFFRRERPILLFLLHVKRRSHELFTVLSSNLPLWIINAEGGDEGGMRIREVRICRI